MRKFFREATLEFSGSDLAGFINTGVTTGVLGAALPISFASETPALRRDDGTWYWEILSHGPGDANLGILNTQGVLLEDHDELREIGTVEPGSARVDADRKSRAKIRISDDGWQMRVASGERPGVSVGYEHLSLLSERVGSDGVPVRAFSWRAFEISLLNGRPADKSVGLYRSLNLKNMNIEQILEMALSGRRSDGRFTRSLAEDYSLQEVIRRMARQESLEGFEREVAESQKNIGGDAISGNFVRFECLLPRHRHTRDMQATIFSQGGAFVQGDMQPAVELLLNHCLAVGLGARVLSGLKGNYVAPEIQSGAVPGPAASSEIAAAQKADLVFSQQVMMPVRIPIQIHIAKQLLQERSGYGTEEAIRMTVREQIGVVMDKLILFGQGANSEPLGIFNTPGVGAVLYGGATNWSSVLSSEKALADANSDIGALGWGLSPATRFKWKQAPRIAATNFPSFLMEGGKVNDYPALVTNQLAANHQSIFGNWNDLFILIWGDGMDFIFDPVTKATEGKVVLTVGVWFNLHVRHAQSFCASVDAANQ